MTLDEHLARTINRLADWKQLEMLEANAKRQGRLSPELVAALALRSTELGLKEVATKAGIVLGELTPAETKIVSAIAEYVGIQRRRGRAATRTLSQVRNRGLIDAAEVAVSKARPTQGYQTLVDANLEDLSFEQIVIDHQEEFSSRAVWYSRRTLGLANENDFPPAAEDGDTQSRTVAMLKWLAESAKKHGGVIPQFSNVDAAAAIGMNDLQKYGQVHGNIQSRIDFACFLCDLPPLGCAASAPFERAWSSAELKWAFPVAGFQAAAQAKIWTSEEFDQVLRQTMHLAGQAHLDWKKALATNEAAIKAWALAFDTVPSRPAMATQDIDREGRSPDWTRDELLLALEMYLTHRGVPPSKDSAEVETLSALLKLVGGVLGVTDTTKYRNANSVYMKMMNFRRFDPLFTQNGKVGLTRGNKCEKVVWDEYADDVVSLTEVCNAIRSTIADGSLVSQLSGFDDMETDEAEEGRILTRLHKVRERSRKLVIQAKRLALKRYGRLECEACGFDFKKEYGDQGEGVIEVHHKQPVHTLAEGHKTRLEDLALLCANCHRVVHSSRRWLSVQEVAELKRASREGGIG